MPSPVAEPLRTPCVRTGWPDPCAAGPGREARREAVPADLRAERLRQEQPAASHLRPVGRGQRLHLRAQGRGPVLPPAGALHAARLAQGPAGLPLQCAWPPAQPRAGPALCVRCSARGPPALPAAPGTRNETGRDAPSAAEPGCLRAASGRGLQWGARQGEAVQDAELTDLLDDVALPHLATKMGGLDAEADWARLLSQGEQQRVAMLRLLLHAPVVAFLDEACARVAALSQARWRRWPTVPPAQATSALDTGTEAMLYRRLQHCCSTYVSVGAPAAGGDGGAVAGRPCAGRAQATDGSCWRSTRTCCTTRGRGGGCCQPRQTSWAARSDDARRSQVWSLHARIEHASPEISGQAFVASAGCDPRTLSRDRLCTNSSQQRPLKCAAVA